MLVKARSARLHARSAGVVTPRSALRAGIPHSGSLLIREIQHSVLGHQSVELLLPVRRTRGQTGNMPVKMRVSC